MTDIECPDRQGGDPMAPAEPPAEDVKAADLRRDATTMMEDMRANVLRITQRLEGVEGKHADRLRSESERLLGALSASRPGVVDLSVFLSKQPGDAEFKFPGRAGVLCAESKRRLQKSRFMFPEPSAVLTAIQELMAGSAETDVAETQVRAAYFFSRMSPSAHGLAASTAMRRLIQAAAVSSAERAGRTPTPDETALLASAKGSLLAFLYEGRRRARG